ncbi:hypothetical protein, partial [Streptomyces sp. NPDC058542]|uniref:hypothetical protein n=1 Tax=Streptomyces sp. NPDC058542 TaxID=3346543 RepID=UPI00365A1080
MEPALLVGGVVVAGLCLPGLGVEPGDLSPGLDDPAPQLGEFRPYRRGVAAGGRVRAVGVPVCGGRRVRGPV